MKSLRLVRLEGLIGKLEELIRSGSSPAFEDTEPGDYPEIGRERLEDLLTEGIYHLEEVPGRIPARAELVLRATLGLLRSAREADDELLRRVLFIYAFCEALVRVRPRSSKLLRACWERIDSEVSRISEAVFAQ